MSDKTFTSIFKDKQDKLVEKIDTEHGLLRKLEAYGVITDMHRSDIEVIFVAVDEFLSATFCLVEYSYTGFKVADWIGGIQCTHRFLWLLSK